MLWSAMRPSGLLTAKARRPVADSATTPRGSQRVRRVTPASRTSTNRPASHRPAGAAGAAGEKEESERAGEPQDRGVGGQPRAREAVGVLVQVQARVRGGE